MYICVFVRICVRRRAHTHNTQALFSLLSHPPYSQLSSLQFDFCSHLSTCTVLLNITIGLFGAKYTEGFSALIFLEPSAAFKAVDSISLKCFLYLAYVTLNTPSYLSTHNFPFFFNRFPFFSSSLKFSIFLSSTLISLPPHSTLS